MVDMQGGGRDPLGGKKGGGKGTSPSTPTDTGNGKWPGGGRGARREGGGRKKKNFLAAILDLERRPAPRKGPTARKRKKKKGGVYLYPSGREKKCLADGIWFSEEGGKKERGEFFHLGPNELLRPGRKQRGGYRRREGPMAKKGGRKGWGWHPRQRGRNRSNRGKKKKRRFAVLVQES